jgi:hypothetical protein
LAVIAACLLMEVGLGGPAAQAQVSSGQRRNVFAVAGAIARDGYGIYLVDVDSGTMSLYEWVPDRVTGRKLRLLAARNYSFDLQLDDYNTEPLPREIKALVEQHRRLGGATSQP